MVRRETPLEHWYRDNTFYFITSKVRVGLRAFAAEEAKAIFCDRFGHYAAEHGYVPWVSSLLDNHYHTLGYLRRGEALGEFILQLHGSVSWLVMKHTGVRHVLFWRNRSGHDYFDGCIQDVLQAERA